MLKRSKRAKDSVSLAQFVFVRSDVAVKVTMKDSNIIRSVVITFNILNTY